MAVLNGVLFSISLIFGVRQIYLTLLSGTGKYGLIAAIPVAAMIVGICGVFYLSALAFSSTMPVQRTRAVVANLALLVAAALIGISTAIMSRDAFAFVGSLAVLGLPAVVNLNQLLRKKP